MEFSGTTSVTSTYSYDENDHRMRIDDGTTIFHYPSDLYQTDSVSGLPTKHVQLDGRDGRPRVGSELYVGPPLTGALATRDDGSRYAMISGFEPSQGLVKVKRAVDVPG